MVLWLSFRDAVNTSLYALAKTSVFSTALKDNHNTTVSHGVIENLQAVISKISTIQGILWGRFLRT